MREHERRVLLGIEQNLLAEAPELADLFDRLAEPWLNKHARKALRLLAGILLLLGVVLVEVSLLLGALVLAGMSVIRWTEGWAGPDEPDRRMQ
jgi:hypothetical protein